MNHFKFTIHPFFSASEIKTMFTELLVTMILHIKRVKVYKIKKYRME